MTKMEFTWEILILVNISHIKLCAHEALEQSPHHSHSCVLVLSITVAWSVAQSNYLYVPKFI